MIKFHWFIDLQVQQEKSQNKSDTLGRAYRNWSATKQIVNTIIGHIVLKIKGGIILNISFKYINIENFKNHSKLQVNFSDITNIFGRNGVGKSSIGDAVTYLLYGTDVLGVKIDPKPIGKDVETKVELLISKDGTDYLLGKSLKKTAKFYINEIPKKATEFSVFIEENLLEKNLFLSLFTPVYFFTQHWQDQRNLLLGYIPEPLNKEVLAAMSNLEVELLEGNLKKYSLSDLESLHRDRYKKSDKSYERASERVITLKEQLEKNSNEKIDAEAIRKKVELLRKKRTDLDEQNQQRYKANEERNQLKMQMDNLEKQINRQKQIVSSIQKEEIQETCSTCGQPLDEDSIQKVKEHRKSRYNNEVSGGQELVKQYNKLKEKFVSLPKNEPIDRSEILNLDDEITDLQTKLNLANRLDGLEQEIEEAQDSAEKIRKERNESLAIIDAIKSFKAKRSELMVNKVDDLFTTISVRLYETLKNGEEKATFEIEMDGKPYSKLSTAEKIKAGLELIDVLSNQSDVITPTFVDNAESILQFVKPTGQLIVARVVDIDFQIKTESLKEEKVNE